MGAAVRVRLPPRPGRQSRRVGRRRWRPRHRSRANLRVCHWPVSSRLRYRRLQPSAVQQQGGSILDARMWVKSICSFSPRASRRPALPRGHARAHRRVNHRPWQTRPPAPVAIRPERGKKPYDRTGQHAYDGKSAERKIHARVVSAPPVRRFRPKPSHRYDQSAAIGLRNPMPVRPDSKNPYGDNLANFTTREKSVKHQGTAARKTARDSERRRRVDREGELSRAQRGDWFAPGARPGARRAQRAAARARSAATKERNGEREA